MRFIIKMALFLIVIGITSSVWAQQEGAYLAAVVKNGSMIGQNSIIAGGRAGWTFGGNFTLGAAFYSLTNKIETEKMDPLTGEKLLAAFNCGGIELGVIYPAKNFLHGSFLLFMGGGGIKPIAADVSVPHTSYYGQSLLVWEPQLNLEADLLESVHLGLGLSYRFITGTKGYFDINNKDLSSLNSLITLSYGLH